MSMELIECIINNSYYQLIESINEIQHILYLTTQYHMVGCDLLILLMSLAALPLYPLINWRRHENKS